MNGDKAVIRVHLRGCARQNKSRHLKTCSPRVPQALYYISAILHKHTHALAYAEYQQGCDSAVGMIVEGKKKLHDCECDIVFYTTDI